MLPQFLLVQLLFVLQDQREEDELAGFDKLQLSGSPLSGASAALAARVAIA